jgi:hypothetical protein
MFTAQRVRIGDLAAGTVLVLDEQKPLGHFGKLAETARLDPDTATLVQELLERWDELEPEHARTLARELVARLDPGIDPAKTAALDRAALRSRLEALIG